MRGEKIAICIVLLGLMILAGCGNVQEGYCPSYADFCNEAYATICVGEGENRECCNTDYDSDCPKRLK